ncbi:nitronate monooxygenase [Paenibacillus sp. MWE-103]|uniref:Probable nitronate monooxygenase n=1 Tax=Paenibacillus artemisiicola TaxID=1172618 RepID=A0ABS3W7S7_9BACL|nr:nitronate monooxygenase family protein [Paenibacillus artemisiicola]MBO7744364.1 nitronate monooxygenase [Paenibacillus artemisiicola]
MKWQTRLTELLQTRYPIVQGGLAYLAYSDLAAAVSNAGGFGQITAMSLPDAHALRQEIRRARTLTDNPFGINFAIGMHRGDMEERLRIAIEERVSAVTLTGGNPAPFMPLLRSAALTTLVLVSSRTQAQKAEQLGASAVIVVGHEGGGHLGPDEVGTMVLVPQVVDAVRIPVVASGGIADGRGWMASHALGAEGIAMGTRFIATRECAYASASYKNALVKASSADTAVIKRSIGFPARVLRSPWMDKMMELERETNDWEALKPYMTGEANKRWIYEGVQDEGFGWAGQAVGLIQDIPAVSALIQRMVREAENLRSKWT